MRINILDYNCGNIWSIKNIFSYLNIEVEIIKTEKEIINSDCLILPGDGSFKIIDDIREKRLVGTLNFTCDKKFIRNMLGMQLLEPKVKRRIFLKKVLIGLREI